MKSFLIIASLFVSFALYFYSCSSVNLSQKIEVSDKDWTMAGGSLLQQNIAKSELSPPLILKWTYFMDAGVGSSCISAADGVLFVNNLQGEMFSIDIATGGKIGVLKFLGNDASSTPLIDGNNVILSYAGDNDYSLASYSLLISEINWRVNLGYLQASPLMKNNFVYCGSLNGKFYKLNLSDSGKKIWSFDSKSPIHSACAIFENKICFGSDNGTLYCLNDSDRTVLWKISTLAPIYSTPMIVNGLVCFGSMDSNYYCIESSNGQLIWKQNMKSKIVTGSAFYSDNVIFGCVDGTLYCLSLKDGSTKWKYQTKGVITGSPVVSGNYVYFTNHDYMIYALDASTGEMKWSYATEGRGKASPVIWDKYLFVATDNLVYCFSK